MLSAQEIKNLHRKYAPNDEAYDLVYGHCQIVNELALWCADRIKEKQPIDRGLLSSAALLHDIGTYVFFAQENNTGRNSLYAQHAILGAKIIADEGIDSQIVQIVETHVLLGLSKQEIIEKPWPLPARDYIPRNIEGEILCYADRFHTKSPTFNTYKAFLKHLEQNFPLQAIRFEALSKKFGIPDIEKMARKYNQPIK